MGSKLYVQLFLPGRLSTGEKVIYRSLTLKLKQGGKVLKVKRLPPRSGTLKLQLELDPSWVGKEVFLLLEYRAEGLKGKAKSDVFKIKSAPLPPSGLRAVQQENRVVLEWKPPAKNWDGSPAKVRGYRVYREEKGRKVLLTEEPVTGTSYVDSDVEHRTRYRYFVTAVSTFFPPYAESDFSEPAELTYLDHYPPSPPTNLTVIFTGEFMLLRWDPSPSSDVVGYNIYRKAEGKVVKLNRNPHPSLQFQDWKVKKGVVYTYWVRAVDRAGNESKPCKAVSEVAK